MQKILLLPDSFKGTLSSAEICKIMEESAHAYFPGCQVISIPIADGGEGSVDSFLSAVGGRKMAGEIHGPYFESIPAYYGLLSDGKTAVIEMAAAAGLSLVEGRKNPLLTTTYGTGEQIKSALEQGAGKIIVGLGGSATNDGGAGAMAALGAKFFNGRGESFLPTGGTLKDIDHIDTNGLHPALAKVQIVAMCDIDNPMYGEQGAAYIFGPQKGADEGMVQELDRGLRHYAEVIRRDLGVDIARVPGSGAAGAMGASMVAFLNAQLAMGIQVLLDVVRFETIAGDADLIFTGEGRLDHQSLRGKAVIGIAKRARALGVPVIAVVGSAEADLAEVTSLGVTAVFPTLRKVEGLEEVLTHSRENMRQTMDNLMALIQMSQAKNAN